MKTRKTNGDLVDFLLRSTYYLPVFQERKNRERDSLTALISVVNKKSKTVLLLLSKVFSLFTYEHAHVMLMLVVLFVVFIT